MNEFFGLFLSILPQYNMTIKLGPSITGFVSSIVLLPDNSGKIFNSFKANCYNIDDINRMTYKESYWIYS